MSHTARLGKDRLTFAEIRYWTGLAFVKNNGMLLVCCGFGLLTLGAILTFMLSYKEIHVKVGQEVDDIQISMGGRARRYKTLFSEKLKEMAERLEEGLGEHARLYTLIRPASLGERSKDEKDFSSSHCLALVPIVAVLCY